MSGNLEAAITARAKERETSLTTSLAKRQADERPAPPHCCPGSRNRCGTRSPSRTRRSSCPSPTSNPTNAISSPRTARRGSNVSTQLPGERDAAIAAIARRYTSVQVLWFPAAVVHLVPAKRNR